MEILTNFSNFRTLLQLNFVMLGKHNSHNASAIVISFLVLYSTADDHIARCEEWGLTVTSGGACGLPT